MELPLADPNTGAPPMAAGTPLPLFGARRMEEAPGMRFGTPPLTGTGEYSMFAPYALEAMRWRGI